MTKLDIIKLAKKTKSQETTAKAIRESFPGYTGATDSETCYKFGIGALGKNDMIPFLKALKVS